MERNREPRRSRGRRGARGPPRSPRRQVSSEAPGADRGPGLRAFRYQRDPEHHVRWQVRRPSTSPPRTAGRRRRTSPPPAGARRSPRPSTGTRRRRASGVSPEATPAAPRSCGRRGHHRPTRHPSPSRRARPAGVGGGLEPQGRLRGLLEDGRLGLEVVDRAADRGDREADPDGEDQRRRDPREPPGRRAWPEGQAAADLRTPSLAAATRGPRPDYGIAPVRSVPPDLPDEGKRPLPQGRVRRAGDAPPAPGPPRAGGGPARRRMPGSPRGDRRRRRPRACRRPQPVQPVRLDGGDLECARTLQRGPS